MKKNIPAIILLASLTPTLSHAATIELDWGVSISASYPNLNINQGDTVKWTWVDPFAISHNVVIEDSSNNNILQTPLTSGAGTMVSYTFDILGDYIFYCDPHANSMNGSLTVNAVPIPAAAWLFGSGLLGLIGVARVRNKVE